MLDFLFEQAAVVFQSITRELVINGINDEFIKIEQTL